VTKITETLLFEAMRLNSTQQIAANVQNILLWPSDKPEVVLSTGRSLCRQSPI